MAKQNYQVLQTIEHPDTAQLVTAGDSITLTAAQAKYLLKQGKIKTIAEKTAKAKKEA